MPGLERYRAPSSRVGIVDPATNTIVGEIGGIDVNHGAAAASDGSRKLLGGVHVGDHPDWLTFTPDGRSGLCRERRVEFGIGCRHRDDDRDCAIPVGQVPKRNITATLP